MPTTRILASSGTKFEKTVGYSRAVRVGLLIAVSGTTASGSNIEAQTREILRRIGVGAYSPSSGNAPSASGR